MIVDRPQVGSLTQREALVMGQLVAVGWFILKAWMCTAESATVVLVIHCGDRGLDGVRVAAAHVCWILGWAAAGMVAYPTYLATTTGRGAGKTVMLCNIHTEEWVIHQLISSLAPVVTLYEWEMQVNFVLPRWLTKKRAGDCSTQILGWFIHVYGSSMIINHICWLAGSTKDCPIVLYKVFTVII